ncbi:hypothetical protein WH50_20780 [Pokkaliibacter plantistimulans]|uniref:Uncharacterized protein n=2 Tax=Pokkaliibacter plantistimulans TaxID=1635171 RepID=A0ABX5LTA4_9GAMM|nr:hypothetical protein WH50_20780 [Pokkaliibacter plantistimulans]
MENNATLIVLGFLLAGFMSGVGAMTFLEGREKEMRQEIMAELKAENDKLKVNNEELDAAIRKILVQYVGAEAIAKGKPLGGENSEVKKLQDDILKAEPGEINKIIRDPTKFISQQLGF